MSTAAARFIPESLLPYTDDNFHEVKDELAGTSLDDFVKTMPETRMFSRYNHAPAIHAAIYRPDEFDFNHAVFSLNPFGNGHQPHMDIRNRAAHRIAAPNAQFVSFPSNTASQRYYQLAPKQLATVAEGDASPIAESIHNTAEELGLETLDLLTYSQGTFVGVALLKLAQKRGVIQINNMLIGDPTNVVDRTEKQLKKAFLGSGLFPLIGAVKDSGIPALEEAQAMCGPRDAIRLAKSLLAAQKASKVPENSALHSGMTHDNMNRILTDLEANDGGYLHTRVTMARAEKSKITPYTESYMNAASFVARQRLEIDGYGHEAADNVTGVWALLSKLALQERKTD